MKEIILSALVISGSLVFTNAALYAAQDDDFRARLEAVEKENAAIKRELAARRDNKALREPKAAAKPASGPQVGAAGSAPVLPAARTNAPARELPAMDVTHIDMGIGRPIYHSGFSGPYGDGNYPGN